MNGRWQSGRASSSSGGAAAAASVGQMMIATRRAAVGQELFGEPAKVLDRKVLDIVAAAAVVGAVELVFWSL